MTEEEFRALCLAFPETVEGANLGSTFFKANGKDLARILGGGRVYFTGVPVEEIEMLTEAEPATFWADSHYKNARCMVAHLEPLALEMARLFGEVDLLIVPSLRDEQLTITNFTGHPSLTLRAGFVEVSEARSDWAPDPANPLPKFSPPRRVPHGITIVGRLFDDGLLGRVGVALERAFVVAAERPAGF